MECANCGKEIEIDEDYIEVKDNFLITKYFDELNGNIFCTEECLMENISAEWETNKS